MTESTASPPPRGFALALLPVLIGCASIVGVTLSYLLAASWGQVPWCIPWWDSCSSISATGRQPPAFFVFKAFLLPVAGLMLLYWPLLAHWIRGFEGSAGPTARWVQSLGVGAALALILYTTLLGAVGELYQLQRRIGIILFFGFTAFAHLLMVRHLWNRSRSQRPPWTNVQLGLSITLLGGGLANSLLAVTYPRFLDIEDAMEWCFATVMMAQFVITGLAWRATGYRLA